MVVGIIPDPIGVCNVHLLIDTLAVRTAEPATRTDSAARAPLDLLALTFAEPIIEVVDITPPRDLQRDVGALRPLKGELRG